MVTSIVDSCFHRWGQVWILWERRLRCWFLLLPAGLAGTKDCELCLALHCFCSKIGTLVDRHNPVLGLLLFSFAPTGIIIATAYVCGASVYPNSWLMLSFCLPFVCLVCMLTCCTRLRYLRLWGATEFAVPKHRQLLLQVRVDKNFFGVTCTACFVCSCQAGWQEEMQAASFANMCCGILHFVLHCLSLHMKSVRSFYPKHSVLLCDPIVPELSPCSLDTWAKLLDSSVVPPLCPQKQSLSFFLSFSLSLCVCVFKKLQLVWQ